MRSIHHSECYCGILLHSSAIRIEECGCNFRRAMSIIFCDHLQKMVECYVDDIAVKSHSKNNHLDDLRTMFDIMRAYQLKMNLTKSLLGVSSGKFLRFIITSKRIHFEPDKVKAI